MEIRHFSEIEKKFISIEVKKLIHNKVGMRRENAEAEVLQNFATFFNSVDESEFVSYISRIKNAGFSREETFKVIAFDAYKLYLAKNKGRVCDLKDGALVIEEEKIFEDETKKKFSFEDFLKEKSDIEENDFEENFKSEERLPSIEDEYYKD